MEIEKKNNILGKHIIHLDNRKIMSITGVTGVVTFNEDMVILNTNMGGVQIKGKGMKVNKLNVDTGDMCIDGHVDSLIYTNKENKNKESLIKRLFK